MNKLYNKGSEWNKWDMHIHTPDSILNNGFGDNWDEYVKKLFKSAIKEKIVAIGITDYFSIDGYKKIKQDYLSNEVKLQELFAEDEIEKIRNIFVFPNIEFRINKLVIGKERDLKWNRKVNFHVVFSDKVSTEDIEENFLNLLKFEDTGVGDGTPQSISLTKRNLTELGERLIQTQADFSSYSPLYVGTLNASVDDTEIVKILSSQNSKFKGEYLLALPADEDLSIVSWSSQGHLSRKVLFQKSHIVFSANQGTVDFSLGYKHQSVEKFKEEFKNTKPCLWGSDAHDFEKLFKPDEDRFTWIKAIPSFEGLKQVVYEPEDRVKIQLNIPEEKTPYLVIDKVRFIDSTGQKEYQPDWIELNQNLNTIIGGKSSGKSLLLYHIAKAIDPLQVAQKTKLIEGSNYRDFIQDHPFDLEVNWKNGDINKLSSDEERKSQITYIPQLHINHLAEKDGKQQLVGLIESILLQNDNYKEFISVQKSNIQDYKSKIDLAIEERLRLTEEFKELVGKRNAIGNAKIVKEEIDRLNKLIDNLKKESGFNEEQNKEYKYLSNRIEKINQSITDYQKTIESVLKYNEFIGLAIGGFNDNAEREIFTFNSCKLEEFIIKSIHHDVISEIENNKSVLSESISELTKKIEIKLTKNKEDLSAFELKITPFKQKIKNQVLLKKLDKELENQKEKLKNINKYNVEIQLIIKNGKEVKNKIFDNYEKLFDCYKDINTELKKPEYYQIDDEIKLESRLIFDSKTFEKFTNLFDNRARLNNYFVRIFNDNNIFIYDSSTQIKAIKEIFEKLK